MCNGAQCRKPFQHGPMQDISNQDPCDLPEYNHINDKLSICNRHKKGKRLSADHLVFLAVSGKLGIGIFISFDQIQGIRTGEVTQSEDWGTLVALNAKLGLTFLGWNPLLT